MASSEVQSEIDRDVEARLRLEEMGFTTEQVDQALVLTDNNFEQGLQYLLSTAQDRRSSFESCSELSLYSFVNFPESFLAVPKPSPVTRFH